MALHRTIRNPTYWPPLFTFGANNQSSYLGTSFVFRTYQLDAAENALETRGLLNDPFKEHQDEGTATATQAQVTQLESQMLKQIGDLRAAIERRTLHGANTTFTSLGELEHRRLSTMNQGTSPGLQRAPGLDDRRRSSGLDINGSRVSTHGAAMLVNTDTKPSRLSTISRHSRASRRQPQSEPSQPESSATQLWPSHLHLQLWPNAKR